MTTAYIVLTTHEGDYYEMVDQYNLMSVFSEVFSYFKEQRNSSRAVIRYIVHYYSNESRFSLAGRGTRENKIRCARLAELPDHLHQEVLDFISKKPDEDEENSLIGVVKRTVLKYTEWQNHPLNMELKLSRDEYSFYLRSSFTAVDANGKPDIKARAAFRDECDRLQERIEKIEEKLLKESGHLVSALKEAKKQSGAGLSIRPENYA